VRDGAALPPPGRPRRFCLHVRRGPVPRDRARRPKQRLGDSDRAQSPRRELRAQPQRLAHASRDDPTGTARRLRPGRARAACARARSPVLDLRRPTTSPGDCAGRALRSERVGPESRAWAARLREVA
jgi:hypothetical protein